MSSKTSTKGLFGIGKNVADKANSPMIRLTGLWEKVDKNGSIYYEGNVDGVKVRLFPCLNKRSEKSPDAELFSTAPLGRLSRESGESEGEDDDPLLEDEAPKGKTASAPDDVSTGKGRISPHSDPRGKYAKEDDSFDDLFD